MKLTIELGIGLSFLLQAALPRLVTDRERKLIVVGGPSDRTGIAALSPHARRGYASRVAGFLDWLDTGPDLGVDVNPLAQPPPRRNP